MRTELKPLKIVIAALGGEGGSVLTKWIVEASERIGFGAQYTSIPGVAQRTGATTYYIELFPRRDGFIHPVLALTPSPCDVDIVIASELLEVGRAIEKGLVTPDRTTLIGSTHRMYAVSEKSAMTDNRYNSETICTAAQNFAQNLVLADLREVSEKSGSIINAVLLGALAATGKLPVDPSVFEDVIRESGKAVESNLKGFSAGFSLIEKPQATSLENNSNPVVESIASLSEFPEITHPFITLGAARTEDYQSAQYSQLYLDRLRRILKADETAGGKDQHYTLTYEMSRYLALRMTYEDVVRVADLKTKAERLQDIRQKSRPSGSIIEVLDYFKPGVEEIRDALPPFLSGLLKPLEAKTFHRPFKGGIKIKTTSVTGFYMLRFLAAFKRWRPGSTRYKAEQRLIENWLEKVIQLSQKNYDLAVEYCECANLLKGYGDTYHRGLQNFNTLTGLLNELSSTSEGATHLKNLRESALKEAEGTSLENTIIATIGHAA